MAPLFTLPPSCISWIPTGRYSNLASSLRETCCCATSNLPLGVTKEGREAITRQSLSFDSSPPFSPEKVEFLLEVLSTRRHWVRFPDSFAHVMAASPPLGLWLRGVPSRANMGGCRLLCKRRHVLEERMENF